MPHSFNKKPPAPPPLPRAWRRAILRLEKALEVNAPADYSERIEILGRQLFGDLWTPRLPGASPSPSGRGQGEGESNRSNGNDPSPSNP